LREVRLRAAAILEIRLRRVSGDEEEEEEEREYKDEVVVSAG
jgi:hypothetical protein